MTARPTPADLRLQVLNDEALDARHHLLTLAADGPLDTFEAGQFVMLRCADSLTLRRPFSIQRLTRGGGVAAIEILYRVVGAGTDALTLLQTGDGVDCLGPLGRPFPFPADGEVPVLLGGGVGIPPMAALAEALMLPGYAEPLVIGGVGGAADRACLHGLWQLPVAPHVATLDGSEGTRGHVIDALEAVWARDGAPMRPHLYACGPVVMLAAVARYAAARDLACHVSMEAVMGCGFGACVGCAVPRSADRIADGETRYALVCQDGPVFDARDLDLDLLLEMD